MAKSLELERIGISQFTRWNSGTLRKKMDELVDEPSGNAVLVVEHQEIPIAVVIRFQRYLSWKETLRTQANLEMGS